MGQVDAGHGNEFGVGAGGDDDVGSRVLLVAHSDGMGIGKAGFSSHQRDAGRGEQCLNTLTQLTHHLVLAVQYLGEVDRGVYAFLAQQTHHLGLMTPGLGGNAAAVQAGAACLGALHNGHLKAQTGGLAGGTVAAGTASYYNKVSTGHALSALSASSCQ